MLPADEMAPYGFIAVSSGDGIAEIFQSLGVDVVLSGGQTMNPSTEDFVKAVRSIAAEQVFILPNNSNIVLGAEQARELLEDERRITVIPSKTIPQGMVTLLLSRKMNLRKRTVTRCSRRLAGCSPVK